MIDIGPFAALVPADHGLAVIAIALPDGSVHASVGNVGVLAHPLTGATIVGLVAVGGARKVRLLRPIRALLPRCALAGNGRPSTDRSNWSVRTTQSPALTPIGYGYCFARSSPPRAAHTTTGIPTTA